MRQQVIQYLQSDRSFNAGAQLYSRLPGKSLAFERQLNTRGNAPGMLQQLHYELGRLVGLAEQQIKAFTAGKLKSVPAAQAPKEAATEQSEAQQIRAALEEDDYYKLQDLVQKLELDTDSRKKEAYRTALIGRLSKREAAEVAEDLPQKVKEAVKLRDQFPFLREKD